MDLLEAQDETRLRGTCIVSPHRGYERDAIGRELELIADDLPV